MRINTLLGRPFLRIALALVSFVVVCGVLVGPAPWASAAPVNLYTDLHGGNWAGAAGTNVLAESFFTGSSPLALSSVTLDIQNINPSTLASITSTYNVTLVQATGTTPGSALASVATSVSEVVNYLGTPTFSLSPAIPLQANSEYFIE